MRRHPIRAYIGRARVLFPLWSVPLWDGRGSGRVAPLGAGGMNTSMPARPVAIVVDKLAPADHDFPATVARTLGRLGWHVERMAIGIGADQFADRVAEVKAAHGTPVVFSINFHPALARWSTGLGLRYVSWGEVYPMELHSVGKLDPGSDVWVFDSTQEVVSVLGNAGANAYFHPLGFDPDVFNRREIERDLEVSFVGNGLAHMEREFRMTVARVAQAIEAAGADPIRAEVYSVVGMFIREVASMSWRDFEAMGADVDQLIAGFCTGVTGPEDLVAIVRKFLLSTRGVLRGYTARLQRVATAEAVARVASLALFGKDWDETAVAPCSRGPIPYRQTAEVFSRTKINLHVHRAYMNGFNDRMINVPACGSLLISRRTPELERVLEPDAEVVVYDTVEELADKVRFFRDNPEARERIAGAGYRRAHETFTFERRLVELLQVAGLPVPARAA